METIPLFKPYHTQEEINALIDVMESGWWGLGPKTAEFEKAFAEYIGVNHAIGMNSCTSALQVACHLISLSKFNPIVLVPPLSFVSTSHAVLHARATPIFCDIDPETLCISPDSIWHYRKRFGWAAVGAVVVVHYGGRCAPIDEIRSAAGDEAYIIEDCAHACGASLNGRMAGDLGEIGCFSFHAVKNLATGDGGMITTNNTQWMERAKQLRWLGIDKGTFDRSGDPGKYLWEYDCIELGYKCHMNDIQAAIGLCQLKRLEGINGGRAALADHYTKLLKDHLEKEVKTPKMDTEDDHSAWHLYPIRVDAAHRDPLMQYLADHGVHTGVHYKPITQFKTYKNLYNFDDHKMPVADEVWKTLISLPIHPHITTQDIDFIVGCIDEYFHGAK